MGHLERGNIDDAIPRQGIVYHYFPCFDLTYVTTDSHDSIILLKDSGRDYKPQTPMVVQFEDNRKKATKVKITYADGSNYFGDVAVDNFCGFLRHGDGSLRDSEHLLLSSGRYYQNEWSPEDDDDDTSKYFHHQDSTRCVNKEKAFEFGTFSGCAMIHPTICKSCVDRDCDISSHFMNMKKTQLAYFAGVVNLTRHHEIETQLLMLFAKAFGSRDSNAVVVWDRFFTSPWDRSTMFHNLFKRKVIRARVMEDFKAIVKVHEELIGLV